MNRFNNWLARKITNAVATMWCAYLFAGLTLISLPAAVQSKNVVTIVSWVAQTFLQLVLLSIILVGQRLQAEQQDKKHQEVINKVAEHHTILNAIHTHLKGDN